MSDKYVQWGFDLVQNSYLNRPVNNKWQDNLYLQYLEPFSKDFYSLNSPILLFGGNDFNAVTQKKIITLRDGLLPLTIFFKESKPEDIDCEIIIHKDLWFIVPEIWRKKVKFFEVIAKNNFSKTNLPQKVFVTGILNSTLADPVEFEEKICQLSEAIGKNNLEKIEIMAYFPDKRTDLWGSWEEENILHYSKAIFKHLKINIITPEWRQIFNEMNFQNCLYYEVNAGLFIKDSYVKHMCLSRGAGLLEQSFDKRFTKISETPASFYHSYCVYDFNYSTIGTSDNIDSDELAPQFKRISTHDFQKVKLNFKWEEWYGDYLKRTIKRRQE